MQAYGPGARGKGDQRLDWGGKLAPGPRSSYGAVTAYLVPAAGYLAARPKCSLDSDGGGLEAPGVGIVCTLVCS